MSKLTMREIIEAVGNPADYDLPAPTTSRDEQAMTLFQVAAATWDNADVPPDPPQAFTDAVQRVLDEWKHIVGIS